MVEARDLEKVLAVYLDRVNVRPGNGLTRAMNKSLRTYPMIPEIITRVVQLLVSTENLTEAPVRLRTVQAYRLLLEIHDDLVREVPVRGNPVVFRREADRRRFSLPAFHFAMAIARRIGLVGGHGRFGLTDQLRRLMKKTDQPVA